ncbi:TonB-dependent receptor [Pseudomonas sp. Bout1]|uniref:TonB-dependent receptor n=1 Tax=Pseudomonas sp. Bout1 TaxID=3048600 RepID=UPI002AB362C9|nr:TonB-dependent receptor [Pseudomonas sp. Bout1]MDY7534796.1 TonB-dependent receptor [Pseudomonas sp. Bout1]MEB0183905.1 TonB-dependent receptor [Pseudomonas sp. Bout1]
MGYRSPAALAILCVAINSAIFQPTQAVAAEPAMAPGDQATRFFDIPAQPLTTALGAFARQANLQLGLEAGLVDGLQAQALRGNFTQEQALQRLLGEAQVSWKIDGQRSLILSRRSQATAAPGDLDESEMLGPVTIKGGETSRLIGDAAQVYTKAGSSVYISGETINRFRGSSPADILKGVPGVQTGDSRNGGALDVNIRGIQGQSRVPVTVDGSQQAIDAYRGYSGMQQRSYIDPDLISSITVDKGPSMGADAAGAIGGMVKMKTLQPKDILKDGETYGLRLKGDISSNSVERPTEYKSTPHHGSNGLTDPDSHSGSVAFASTSDVVDFVAAYSQRANGNYYAGKKGFKGYQVFQQVRRYDPKTRKYIYVTQEANSAAKFFKPDSEVFNTSSDTESVLLKTIIKPSPDQALELTYRYTDGEYGEVMPSQVIRNTSGSVPQWQPGTMRINAYTARYTFKPEDNPLIDFSANAWTTKAQSEAFNGLVTVTPLYGHDDDADPLGETYQDALRNRTKDKRWGVDLNNTSRFDTRAGKLAWSYGGSYQEENLGPDDNSPVLQSDLEKNRFIRSGERQEGSLVSSLEWKPVTALTITAGGRYSEFSSKDHNRKAKAATFDADRNPTSYTYAAPIERDDHAFAPSFGAKLNVTDNSFIYLNYNQGVRMPSLFESTLGLFTAAVPGDHLKPERSKNWEFGASTLKNGLLVEGDTAAAKLAYFNNKIENYITRDYTDIFAGNLQNVDSFTVKGIEVQTSYDMGRVFTDVSATYYLNAKTCAPDIAKKLREEDDPNTPNCVDGGFPGSYTNTQNPPKYSINTTLGSRWFDNSLVLGGRMVYNSAPTAKLNKPWNDGITTNQMYYRKSAIFDLFASYEIVKGTQLDFSVQNLTNVYYLDPLAQSFMPAPGRTLRTGLTVKF